MPRWKQVWNEEEQKSEFIPLDEAAARHPSSAYVQGDIETFRSPIDGAVISDRKQLREHCKRHGVVQQSEFDDNHFKRKAAERARLYTGERTKEQSLNRKREINEIINHLERRG